MMAALTGQLLIMALLMGGGLVLRKKKFLSRQGSSELGNILVNIIIPCVILKSYMVEFSVERLNAWCLSIGLSLLSLLAAMGISWLAFGTRNGILNFASSFGNAGFIGIPLAQALFGEEAVFYIAAYVALLNLFQWTYGLYVMTGDREKVCPSAVLKNPVFISIILGTVLFLLPIHYPDIVIRTLGYVADVNTPVAMVILGGYLAELKRKEMTVSRELFRCMILRLIVIPAVTLGLFYILPIKNSVMVFALFIASATSVGGNIAVFASQQRTDYLLAVKTVCLSSVLSVITMPVLFCVAQRLF